jgi:hypothetical protein
MKLEHDHQNTCDETFLHTIYKIYFPYNYRFEISAVQVCFTISIYCCKLGHETDVWMILRQEKHRAEDWP